MTLPPLCRINAFQNLIRCDAPSLIYMFIFPYTRSSIPVFALGLLINSPDLLDTKMVISTSEQPELTAKCVWQHIQLSELDYDIPVAVGRELPPYADRASVCGIPGLVGFALEGECNDVDAADVIEDGLAAMAEMIMESDRDDWWYIVIGGQTTLKALIVEYPEAAAKIDTVIIMGGKRTDLNDDGGCFVRFSFGALEIRLLPLTDDARLFSLSRNHSHHGFDRQLVL